MVTKTIAWNNSSENITLTYTGQGDGSVSVTSDTNDSYDAREQYITIETNSGSPQVTRQVLVKQKGKTIPAGTVYNFDYTGTVQEVTLPAGRYKLQCWGAQGGSVSGSYTANGSKGGYSEGVLNITSTYKFYIFVGGKGTDSSTSSTSGTDNGGWNGGGGSVRYSSYDSSNTYGMSYPRPGGGATDIALVTSDMAYSSYRNNRSSTSLLSRIIVAGGGAGASARYTETTVTDSTTTTMTKTPFRITVYQGVEVDCRYLYDDTFTASTSYTVKGIGSEVTYKTSAADGGFWLILLKPSTGNTFEESDYANVYVEYDYVETSTSTSTSDGKSNASQQGGGTSGLGTSPGTQNGGGGEFGKGKNQTTTNYRYDSGAGGGGWYGGGSSYSDSSTSQINASGGGSGFVNTAANASYRPSGYTGLQLESGETKAGNTSFPSTGSGNETGHAGNGYARITVLCEGDTGEDAGGGTSASFNWATQSGAWGESSNSSASDGKQWTCVSPGSNESAIIRCTFSGVSSITFRCCYQGESNYDYMTVGDLDSTCTRDDYGTTLQGTSGTWKSITFTPSDTGTHYVEFCYSKDGSVDESSDNADVYIESYS